MKVCELTEIRLFSPYAMDGLVLILHVRDSSDYGELHTLTPLSLIYIYIYIYMYTYLNPQASNNLGNCLLYSLQACVG